MHSVTLETIGGGALAELFGVELARILANIADPNTDPAATRLMTITVKVKPNRNRDVADVKLTCTSKLAGILTVSSQLFMGRSNGRLIAVENDPRQSTLFDPERPTLSAGASALARGEFQKKEGD